jgi:hypothetical protein
MKATVIIVCISLCALTACKKEVSDGRSEFIGNWTSEIFREYNIAHLSIDENSNASFRMYYEGHDRKEYTGKARANNKHFKIGRTRYFDIIEFPHRIDTTVEKYSYYDSFSGRKRIATWKMVLEGMKPDAFHVCERLSYYRTD